MLAPKMAKLSMNTNIEPNAAATPETPREKPIPRTR